MSKELVKQTELQEVVARTNNILTENSGRVSRANEAGKNLIATIESGGMNDAIDEQCNSFLVACRKTQAHISEQRKPITQLFDNVKKLFTTLESDLDPKKGTCYPKIQAYRDQWAAHKAAEQKKREDEARLKLAADNERAELRTKVATDFHKWLEDLLTKNLDEMSEVFNSATLENINDVEPKLRAFEVMLNKDMIKGYNPSVRVAYIKPEEAIAIQTEVVEEKFLKFIDTFRTTMVDYRADLVTKIPSKERELKEIAQAEAEDKKKADLLKAEQKKREEAEATKRKQEAADREKKAQEEARLKEESSKMDGLFNATAEVMSDEQKNVRKSLEIVIKHPQAYIPIFQFWFEKEGRNLPIDKLEKFTLLRMQSFCEAWATREGETIESPYLKYQEKIKTIAKA